MKRMFITKNYQIIDLMKYDSIWIEHHEKHIIIAENSSGDLMSIADFDIQTEAMEYLKSIYKIYEGINEAKSS